MKKASALPEIILDIIAIAFVFLLPHFGLIPFPFFYIVPVLAFIWIYLKKSSETFASIYFSLANFQLTTVAVGAAAACILLFLLSHVLFPLLSQLVHLRAANLADFRKVRGHFLTYCAYLIAGLVVGGFYEEVVFHGFIYTRFRKIITGKNAAAVAFGVTNLLFGLYHFQQGPSGIITAFIAGCAYQGLMLQFGRNLWYAIFFHAFFDAIGLTYIYLGYW